MDSQTTDGAVQPDPRRGPGRKRIEELAKVSLAAPLVACFVGFLARSAIADPTAQMVIAYAQGVLIVSGLACGVIALFKVGKYGREKILVPAAVGVGFVLVIIAAVIIALPTIRRMARQKQLATAKAQALAARKFTAPSGFVDLPEGRQQEKVIWSYVKGKGEGLENCTFIFVEEMGGLIKQEDLAPHLPSRPDVSLFKESWKSLNIDVFRVKESLQGLDVLTFNAQVPLVPCALQVKVIGPEKREKELRDVLKQALANLQGVTNWK